MGKLGSDYLAQVNFDCMLLVLHLIHCILLSVFADLIIVLFPFHLFFQVSVTYLKLHVLTSTSFFIFSWSKR